MLPASSQNGFVRMPLNINRDVFITCAVTGAGETVGRSDKVPVTPEQIADAAIVPVKADFHSTSAAGRHTRNILDDQASGIKIAIRAIVPTFVDYRLRLTRSMLQQLTKTYGNLVTMPIPNTVRVAEAPASGGRTVLEYSPESPASTAYWHLVDTIYNGAGGEA